MKLGEWLRRAAALLAEAGVTSARLEAQVLAAHVLRLDRAWVIAHPEHEAPDLALQSVLDRRLAGEPLAYILGHREFYGRQFRVTPAVLIPRQETETLVTRFLELNLPQGAILDVGTGSGCLAITLALECPNLLVHALDISPDALEIARQNADDWGATVTLWQSDLLAAVEPQRYHAIISNPPYVEADADLTREVRHHEPAQALFAGPDGLDLYRRLIPTSQGSLFPGGFLLLEVGDGQAGDVRSLLGAEGFEVRASGWDLNGTERVVVGQSPIA